MKSSMHYTKALSVLAIKMPFTEDQLKKAYRESSKKSHPDLGGSSELFAEVQEAYSVLKPLVGKIPRSQAQQQQQCQRPFNTHQSMYGDFRNPYTPYNTFNPFYSSVFNFNNPLWSYFYSRNYTVGDHDRESREKRTRYEESVPRIEQHTIQDLMVGNYNVEPLIRNSFKGYCFVSLKLFGREIKSKVYPIKSEPVREHATEFTLDGDRSKFPWRIAKYLPFLFKVTLKGISDNQFYAEYFPESFYVKDYNHIAGRFRMFPRHSFRFSYNTLEFSLWEE